MLARSVGFRTDETRRTEYRQSFERTSGPGVSETRGGERRREEEGGSRCVERE
jgi:hypothetical protein